MISSEHCSLKPHHLQFVMSSCVFPTFLPSLHKKDAHKRGVEGTSLSDHAEATLAPPKLGLGLLCRTHPTLTQSDQVSSPSWSQFSYSQVSDISILKRILLWWNNKTTARNGCLPGGTWNKGIPGLLQQHSLSAQEPGGHHSCCISEWCPSPGWATGPWALCYTKGQQFTDSLLGFHHPELTLQLHPQLPAPNVFLNTGHRLHPWKRGPQFSNAPSWKTNSNFGTEDMIYAHCSQSK